MWLREYVLVWQGKAWRIGYDYLLHTIVYRFEVPIPEGWANEVQTPA